MEPGALIPDYQQSIDNPSLSHLRWRVVHISKPSENSTSADWEEPTLVEQSMLANSSKFIDGSFDDLTNSSSAIEDQLKENTASDFTNGNYESKEPIVVEQSVLADSSNFIQITDEEEVDKDKDDSLFSELEVKEEEGLPEDIVSE